MMKTEPYAGKTTLILPCACFANGKTKIYAVKAQRVILLEKLRLVTMENVQI